VARRNLVIVRVLQAQLGDHPFCDLLLRDPSVRGCASGEHVVRGDIIGVLKADRAWLNLSPYPHVGTLAGGEQTLALGPVASLCVMSFPRSSTRLGWRR
jgi:hypothetical protein